MTKDVFAVFTPQPIKKDPTVDMCKCSECGGVFKIDDCDHDFGHHNGWEMPPYTEILCVVCPDGGCIDDFWYSDELLRSIEVSDQVND